LLQGLSNDVWVEGVYGSPWSVILPELYSASILPRHPPYDSGLLAAENPSYAHHRPIPPWTARTGRRDIARGRAYSRLGRDPGGVTDHHAARPTRGPHHCREVPRKDDTTSPISACSWKERKNGPKSFSVPRRNSQYWPFNFHRLACWTCMKHFMKVGYLFSG
jgi:hypothetical protein